MLTLSELDEKVSEAGIIEEPLLSFLGVLVHGVSDHHKIDGSSLDHLLDILLLEVVAQNDGKDG